jgi:hypothetical protein
MAEYAGFQEREGTDFAGSINDLATKVSGLETKVKEVRASDKKLMTDNDALLDAHKPFNFTGSTDFNAKAAVTIRQSMYDLNKKLNNREISPADYRLAMQNIKTDWQTHIDLFKTNDDRMLEEKKRLEPGPDGLTPIASGQEIWGYDQLNKFWTQLENKKMFVGPNGKLASAETDAEGKIVEGTIYDITSQANVNNIANNRLNLRDNVSKDVKALGDFSEFTINADGSTKDISAIEADPAFQTYKEQIMGKYINNQNPSVIGGILVDNSNGGFRYYGTESEKKQIIQDAIAANKLISKPKDEATLVKETEAKLIKMEQATNGVWTPVITKELRDEAAKIVSNEIMSQIGYDEKGTGRKVQQNRDKSLTPQQAAAADEKRNVNKYVYESSANAFLDTPRYDGLDTDNYSFTQYTAPDGFKHVVVTPYKTIDGIKTLDKKSKIDVVDPKKLTFYVKNKRGTNRFTEVNYDDGMKVWTKEGGELLYEFPEENKKVDTKTAGTVAPTKKPVYTAAQEANIKATIKANPGATREQAAKALGY